MKTSLLTLALIITVLGSTSFATGRTLDVKPSDQKSWTFTFKSKDIAQLTLKANSREEAYKLAAKECYQTLTHGEYPGEAKGLDYIDICANPKM